jgi:hypothetical protein
MKDTEKTMDIIGLVVYIVIALYCAVIGSWAAFVAWSACALVQLTVMAVRKKLKDTIDFLTTDRDWYKQHSSDTLQAAQDINKLNDGLIETCQELSDCNKEYLEDLTCLNEVVQVMQKYLTVDELHAVNDLVKDTGYSFSNVNVPGGEYVLHINKSLRVKKKGEEE